MHVQQMPQLTAQNLPNSPMDRADSPHGSEHSRYSGPRATLDAMSMHRSYPSPNAIHNPMHMSDPSMGGSMMLPSLPPNIHHMAAQGMPQDHLQQAPEKAYPCSTCGKRFARRSDLARHERIHSGHRPHVCEYPNCGKQFIQRSALTVHQRVHTGEKPHVCERCSKPFSDSSSLARHRRIHSGKRPYKCPYADCQKTFTRRTTLTRHQNHHSGTIEESVAAVAEGLARAMATRGGPRQVPRSDGGDGVSTHGSPMTTPSPAQRNMSMSPGAEMAAANSMQSYMSNSSLPVHLRGDVHVGSPSSTSSAGYGSNMRPTSHPTSYGPPPTLEPSIEHHQSGPGSAGGSPHMGSVGWQSPSHVPSPAHSGNGYVYPDPDTYPPNAGMGQLFYASAAMRRPQSTEPPVKSELWAGAQ
jgi:DNA-directed RNA polymerase subunit RPC12/RpoP